MNNGIMYEKSQIIKFSSERMKLENILLSMVIQLLTSNISHPSLGLLDFCV